MNTFLKNKPKIKEKLAKIPQAIGIYYYKDKANHILYIGKAKNIQKMSRVILTPRTTILIDELAKQVSSDLKLAWGNKPAYPFSQAHQLLSGVKITLLFLDVFCFADYRIGWPCLCSSKFRLLAVFLLIFL